MLEEDLDSRLALPDDGLIRRVKALACTAPLQALEANKGSLGRVRADRYQMVELALHAIDQVAMSMDFENGAAHADVIRQVGRFAAAQVPEDKPDDHRAVAEWVLQKLINVGTLDRNFVWKYGRTDEAGNYALYDWPFRLLVEHPVRHTNEVVLRVTDEAINVLVGALDTDVESAQVAAEYKLENLITRGRLADAKLAAEQARYRTVQYGEYLRQYLEATKRDVRTVDWEEEVPKLLDEALGHIESRYRHENAILANITDKRDQTQDPRKKLQAAELVDIVRDCINRHMQLQSKLQGAGALFRSEQDRQQFSGPVGRPALDVYGQVLTPLLGLPVGQAAGPTAGFFRAGAAPAAPVVISIAALTGRLLRPRFDRPLYAGAVPAPDLAERLDDGSFTDEDRLHGDHVLDMGIGECHSLNTVLASARRFGADVERYVLHRAANAFNPAVSEALLRGVPDVLVATSDSVAISSPHVEGDGLLLSRVAIEPGDDWADDQNVVFDEEIGL
ncbi:hypothetical protein [Streptomyces malaysiensis]|uniref:hypothetical protein n=1 Tax=Streptomyces malaysiensis TaxID=92644 RepID=UPI0032207B92|nr:hypothetical protein [Streptomyces malaysiensis]